MECGWVAEETDEREAKNIPPSKKKKTQRYKEIAGGEFLTAVSGLVQQNHSEVVVQTEEEETL